MNPIFLSLVGFLLGAATLAALLNYRNGGDDEQYAVCEEHGHDFRERQFEGLEFTNPDLQYHHRRQFEKAPHLGQLVGYHEIMKVFVQHCRDCSETEQAKERQGTLYRFCDEDGESTFLTKDQYDTLTSNED